MFIFCISTNFNASSGINYPDKIVVVIAPYDDKIVGKTKNTKMLSDLRATVFLTKFLTVTMLGRKRS